MAIEGRLGGSIFPFRQRLCVNEAGACSGGKSQGLQPGAERIHLNAIAWYIA